MIQAVMLIALGFLAASLLWVLVAPSLWNRAYRLSKQHIEKTLPVSVSEIEAVQDQLRATFAVRLRRLETMLANARQKSAAQLVDNSHLQMQIITLKEETAALKNQLAERANAANVLQTAVTQRVPDLEKQVELLQREAGEHVQEAQILRNKLKRRDDTIESTSRALTNLQTEYNKLLGVMERTGSDRNERRLRRQNTWSVQDYQSECEALHAELSKLRQEVVRLKDRDAQQMAILRGDLQRVAEFILTQAEDKPANDGLLPGRATLKRPTPADLRRMRPQPVSPARLTAQVIQQPAALEPPTEFALLPPAQEPPLETDFSEAGVEIEPQTELKPLEAAPEPEEESTQAPDELSEPKPVKPQTAGEAAALSPSLMDRLRDLA